MIGPPQIVYGSGPITLTFGRPPQNFIAEDSARRHDNLSTSGFRESVYESSDILISFTMTGLLPGGDFSDWKNFYAWGLSGQQFTFIPNVSKLIVVVVAGVPHSFVPSCDCVIEDTGFKPKKVGFGRYEIDCKFRLVPDGSAFANSGAIMNAFWDAPL